MGECIDSVCDFADEILVVDAGLDAALANTRLISRRAPVRITLPWEIRQMWSHMRSAISMPWVERITVLPCLRCSWKSSRNSPWLITKYSSRPGTGISEPLWATQFSVSVCGAGSL